MSAVVRNFARAVACPADPIKRSVSSQSFYALFRNPAVPASQCSEQQLCLSSQACWGHVLSGASANLIGYATEVCKFPCCRYFSF